MSDVTRILSQIEQGDRQAAEQLLPLVYTSTDLIAFDESLKQRKADDPAAASVVKFRYFAGLTMPEIADVLGISLRSAERNWTYAMVAWKATSRHKSFMHKSFGKISKISGGNAFGISHWFFVTNAVSPPVLL